MALSFTIDSHAQRSSASGLNVERSAFCSRAAFTVLELLIVMGVFSILLSILLPVFRTAYKATLKTRAKIEATALTQAVVQYKNVYGYWPGMVKDSNSQLLQNDQAFANTPSGVLDWPLVSQYSNTWLTVSVRLSDGTQKEANYLASKTATDNDNLLYRSLLPFDKRNTDNLNPLNPLRIRFLTLSNETDPLHTSLPDPWGNEYIVVMGLNPASQFTQTIGKDNATIIQTISVSNLTAFAFSLGPDSTNLIFSAGVPQ